MNIWRLTFGCGTPSAKQQNSARNASFSGYTAAHFSGNFASSYKTALPKMKKILLAVTAVAACLQLAAQYTFSESSGQYIQLSANADTITDPVDLASWDDNYIRIGLPFPVNSYGVWYDSCLVETNGELILYHDWTGLEPWDVDDTLHAIMGFGEFISMNGTGDLMSRGNNMSPILMEVIGNPGAQILKIEWRNSGFYEDTSALMTNFVNFQIWIHEFTGDVEVHIGTSFIEDISLGGSDGPTIGIAEYYMVPNVYALQSGMYVSGTPTTETGVANYTTLNGVPGDSTIYFFTNLATVGINHIEKTTFSMYPNPANEYCTIRLWNSNSSVMVTDAIGRIVMENTAVSSTTYTLNLSGYETGLYFVTVTGMNGSSTRALSVH